MFLGGKQYPGRSNKCGKMLTIEAPWEEDMCMWALVVLLFQLFHRFERFKKVLGRKGKIENRTYDVNPKLEGRNNKETKSLWPWVTQRLYRYMIHKWKILINWISSKLRTSALWKTLLLGEWKRQASNGRNYCRLRIQERNCIQNNCKRKL